MWGWWPLLSADDDDNSNIAWWNDSSHFITYSQWPTTIELRVCVECNCFKATAISLYKQQRILCLSSRKSPRHVVLLNQTMTNLSHRNNHCGLSTNTYSHHLSAACAIYNSPSPVFFVIRTGSNNRNAIELQFIYCSTSLRTLFGTLMPLVPRHSKDNKSRGTFIILSPKSHEGHQGHLSNSAHPC